MEVENGPPLKDSKKSYTPTGYFFREKFEVEGSLFLV